MKLNEVENEATELLGSDHIYLTRPSEPLPEDELKYILGSNLGLGGGSDLSWVYLRDKKSQNTGGGTFTSGAWQTRDLTEEVYDGDNICSLGSNQIILESGLYMCLASAPAYAVLGHQIRLYNVTDASELLIGSSEHSYTVNPSQTRSWIFGPFEVAASKYLEIQHRCASTQGSTGLGMPANNTDEIYTQAIFAKIA